MIDFGIRQRCENCKYGHCDLDNKKKPIKAYCSKMNIELKGKEFEKFNCMYFEREEVNENNRIVCRRRCM